MLSLPRYDIADPAAYGGETIYAIPIEGEGPGAAGTCTKVNCTRSNALYKPAAAGSSGHGGGKHAYGAAQAAKKSGASAGAGTGGAQKLAGKSGHGSAAAAGAQRVGAHQGTHSKRPAKKHAYLDIVSSAATSTAATAAHATGAAGSRATVYDVGVSPHDKAEGTSNPTGSRGVGSAYGREHYGNPVYTSNAVDV